MSFLFPLCAFAHGEEILFTSAIYLFSIVGFLLVLTTSKLESAFKLELTITYILSLGMIVLFTWKIPYDKNKNLLDMIRGLGPALITWTAYLFSNRTKKDRVKE